MSILVNLKFSIFKKNKLIQAKFFVNPLSTNVGYIRHDTVVITLDTVKIMKNWGSKTFFRAKRGKHRENLY